jgi:ubiquinone/menaquinone biosynthesis C-methylase UbiE
VPDDRQDRWRRNWDRAAPSLDRLMALADRYVFADSRTWVCSRAAGATLEVAVGTGLNLPFYPAGVRLTGIDFSPGMLAIARQRAGQLGREADLREADALALPFPDGAFDTVVGTYALCAISDDRAAIAEMSRVLRPGGLLLLADHVEASPRPLRAVQRASERLAITLHGEHFTRRPLRHVQAQGLRVEEHERFRLGIAERLAARKP